MFYGYHITINRKTSDTDAAYKIFFIILELISDYQLSSLFQIIILLKKCTRRGAFFHVYKERCRMDGNVLFLSVPDEESYSVGMRGAAGFLADLREREKLSYDLLIDLEPMGRDEKGQEAMCKNRRTSGGS